MLKNKTSNGNSNGFFPFLEADVWSSQHADSSPVDTWQRFIPFTGVRRSKVMMDNLNSEKNFRKILRRECARSDRNGHGFSLVTFKMENNRSNATATRRLVDVLAEQLRLTDEIGLFDRQHIGVILYDTSSDGAQAFVDKIQRAVTQQKELSQSNVITYPADWKNTRIPSNSSQQ